MTNESQIEIPASVMLWVEAMNAIYPDRAKRWNKVNHLVHYTSLASFKRICESGTIFLSSVADMNDRDEVTEAVYQVIELFGSGKPACLFKQMRELYPEMHRRLEHYLDRAYSDHEVYNNIYCLCTSEHDRIEDKDGKLAMWRAYGGDGNGVAIVLSKAPEDDEDEQSHLETVPVDYLSAARFRVKARKALLKPLERLMALKPTLDDADQQAAAYYLLKVVLMLAVSFKHRGFQEEREWRLVYIREPFSATPPAVGTLSAVETGRRLRPVLKVNLAAITQGVAIWDQISDIIVGPSDDQRMHMTALSNLLFLDLRWPKEAQSLIKPSSIPYRSRIQS